MAVCFETGAAEGVKLAAGQKPPWQKPAPKGQKSRGLSDEWREKARERAAAAGRPYPNLVDNMWASRMSKTASGEGDYMAVPSAERMLGQGQQVLQYLRRAARKNRRLEDWVESKLTTMAGDMDDVHGYVMHSPDAKVASSLVPPESVRAAARRGLESRRKAPKSRRGGLTAAEAGAQGIGSGVVRAQTLASGRAVSPETVKRMHAFFSRHRKNKDTPKGRIAWDLWGGDPGASWAAAWVREMK